MPNYNITPPTNEQLLALAMQEYGKALQALTIGKGDRRLEHQRVKDLQTQIEWLEGRVAADNGQESTGGVVYAGFVQPQ